MISFASARQSAGTVERQSEDAEQSSGVIPTPARLRDAFLRANLEHLNLQPLTREAVEAASAELELTELTRGHPVLRASGKVLGGAPEDAELARIVKDDEQALYVVFGIGLGETARALRAYTEAPIIVFEPDPSVLRGVLELGPAEFSHFDIVTTTHDLTQIWPTLFTGRKTATVVYTAGYGAAYPDAAANLRTALSELVQRSRVNHQTHRLRARDWVADVLANVELLCEHPGILALAGKYRGVPAFIVGAGPSLAKNGHELVQATKKGLVFALNSSARALDRFGVEPQLLACMESIDVSHLLADVSYIDRCARAFTLTAHPNTVRTGNGPLLPLWEGIQQLTMPLKQLTGLDGVAVSGSVSTIAFALAHRLGCSPIVFVGQDLAYTDGRAYAAGTPYEASRVGVSADGRTIQMNWCDTLKRTHNSEGRTMHESEPLNEALAWGGTGKVLTSIGFSAVRAWLEGAAVVLGREAQHVRLVNATEGGARIHGFEEIALAELLQSLPDREIRAQDLAAEARQTAAPITRQDIVDWAHRNADAVARARHAARRTQRIAQTTLSGLRIGSPDVPVRLRRLDAAERELARAVAEAPLLDAWSWADVDRVMGERSARSDDARESAEQSLEFELRFSAAIDTSARALERTLRDLATHLRGESSAPASAAAASALSSTPNLPEQPGPEPGSLHPTAED